MPTPVPHEEIEIKLRVTDVAMIRSRLKRLRARQIAPRTYESNTLYDTPRSDLRRRGQLIRLRIEEPASRRGKRLPNENAAAILTYKGPSRAAFKSTRRAERRNDFKIKEEAEVRLAGPDEMARILRALGLRPVFRYEKFRTTFALSGAPGLKIELDETPVGIYLELEGPFAAIDRGARLLGYTRKDYLRESYGALYQADCRTRRQKPGDMLFPPTKK